MTDALPKIKSKVYNFGKFEGYLMDDNIIYMHYFDDIEVDVDVIEKGFELHDILGVDETVRRVIHCEKFVSITAEARDLVARESRPAAAEVYVIPSLHQKILFNIYVKIRRKKHPSRAFDNLEDALEWVKQF